MNLKCRDEHMPAIAYQISIFSNRSQLSGEETFGQSHQGAFVMSNPLMMIRDDEPSGDPLYLTPSEMTEFDRLGTLNTPTKQQKTKHK